MSASKKISQLPRFLQLRREMCSAEKSEWRGELARRFEKSCESYASFRDSSINVGGIGMRKVVFAHYNVEELGLYELVMVAVAC